MFSFFINLVGAFFVCEKIKLIQSYCYEPRRKSYRTIWRASRATGEMIMAKKGQKFKKYSAEYKLLVIKDKQENNLSYWSTVKKYWNVQTQEISSCINTIKRWEKQYEKEGILGLAQEQRGRAAVMTKNLTPEEGGQPTAKMLEEIRRIKLRLVFLENECKKNLETSSNQPS